MAILAGKYFWIGLALASLYSLINYLFDKTRYKATVDLLEKLDKSFLLSTLITCVLISTSFLLNPSGLTGVASGLVNLFNVNPISSLPLLLPLFLLLTYSLYLLLPFGKALVNLTLRPWYLDFGLLLGLLLITVLFRDQIPGLYAFIELFLFVVVARSIETFKNFKPINTMVGLISFLFFAVILTFTLLSFNQFTQRILGEFNFIVDLLPMLLALALILISYLLIGLGWGFEQTKPALQAAVMTIAIMFSLGFSLSQTWNDGTASQLLFSNSEILFPDSPLKSELAVFIENKVINPTADSYKIENSASIGENWEFKEFIASTKTSSLPVFIINDSVSESGLMAPYRGTSIIAIRRLNLSNRAYFELLHLISSKMLPVSDITKTLWVKTALFPGGK
jgi:hypothetical protein